MANVNKKDVMKALKAVSNLVDRNATPQELQTVAVGVLPDGQLFLAARDGQVRCELIVTLTKRVDGKPWTRLVDPKPFLECLNDKRNAGAEIDIVAGGDFLAVGAVPCPAWKPTEDGPWSTRVVDYGANVAGRVLTTDSHTLAWAMSYAAIAVNADSTKNRTKGEEHLFFTGDWVFGYDAHRIHGSFLSTPVDGLFPIEGVVAWLDAVDSLDIDQDTEIEMRGFASAGGGLQVTSAASKKSRFAVGLAMQKLDFGFPVQECLNAVESLNKHGAVLNALELDGFLENHEDASELCEAGIHFVSGSHTRIISEADGEGVVIENATRNKPMIDGVIGFDPGTLRDAMDLTEGTLTIRYDGSMPYQVVLGGRFTRIAQIQQTRLPASLEAIRQKKAS